MPARGDVTLLYPLLAMVVLTLLVWLRLYATRIAEIRRHRLRLQDIASAVDADRALAAVAGPSDNFRNLFEMPVLFYVLLLLAYVSGDGDALMLAGAWGFVLLRALHSLIHVTSNRVKYRFAAYLGSTLLLWLMWARFGWGLMA